MLYKIVAKIPVNILKHILPSIISKEQSAFIPKRLITNNMLVAFEVMHFLRKKIKRKKGFTALKIDMSKANQR